MNLHVRSPDGKPDLGDKLFANGTVAAKLFVSFKTWNPFDNAERTQVTRQCQ